jgi:hypothetical protein
MKKFIFLLFLISGFQSHGQTSFEQGYFIDNEGKRTECYIRNLDWKNNPSEFQYKITENDEIKTASLPLVQEFGISTLIKFIRYTVNIDRSSSSLTSMSNSKDPEFTKEQLFLKVLVEGNASLYSFEDRSVERFFFRVDESEAEQLIYKPYRISDTEMGVNTKYKEQLWMRLKCSDISTRSFENTDYRKSHLIGLFVSYNTCTNSAYTNYSEKVKRDAFNLTLRPGTNFSSLSIENSQATTLGGEFNNEVTFRVGVEAEIILPFKWGKWTMLTEPTYNYFKSEEMFDTRQVRVDYKYIQIPLGIRHYFISRNVSKVFVNALYVWDFSLDSSVNYEAIAELEISGANNFAVGLGYKYANTFSLEFRYFTNKEIITNYTFWNSDFKSFSLIVGYTFF